MCHEFETQYFEFIMNGFPDNHLSLMTDNRHRYVYMHIYIYIHIYLLLYKDMHVNVIGESCNFVIIFGWMYTYKMYPIQKII